jgi:peptidoglycan/LPS O-acetylase OafA/YrhL
MAEAEATTASKPRLEWLDVIKGLSILWIVFFHCFGTYVHDQVPSPTGPEYYRRYLALCGADDWLGTVFCAGKATAVAIARLGYHAVGVFLLLSGLGLALTLAATPSAAWSRWYRRRLLRLFPMYWVAHLIYLVSPFVARPEPIDYRFLLSALGDRIYPIDSIFYYANPAWWYFGLLLQLYLIFPVLFRLLQRTGLVRFLVFCGAVTITTRYVMMNVIPLPGAWVQGGFFGARLWEFAAGMALGAAMRVDPVRVTAALFRPGIFVLGIFLYAAGLYSYGSMTTYALTDGLIGTGLFIVLAHLAHVLVNRGLAASLARIGAYSYGLYLIHQPYVIYVGDRMRDFGMPAFLAVTIVVMAVLVAILIPLERSVTRAVDALAARWSGPPPLPEGKAVSG